MRKIICFLLTLIIVFSSMPAVFASETENTTISVEDVYASAGSEVDVCVKIKNNPGVAGAKITIAFDSRLILVGATCGEAFECLDYTRPGQYISPCSFIWDSENKVSQMDGDILTLTFKVTEDTVSDTELPIEISYRYGDIYDGDLESLNVTMENGSVTLINYEPGDANSDTIVNGKDVTFIRRYLAGGYGVTVNEAAADVNADAIVNGKDVTLIRRFLAGGYGVTLKRSPIGTNLCMHNIVLVPSKESTCVEHGNNLYWRCEKCKKAFSDSNGYAELSEEEIILPLKEHSVVTDVFVEPTYESTGLTEGKHCSKCGVIIQAQEVIPKLQETEYPIIYYVDNNDSYLKSISITNSNPAVYSSEKGLKLSNIKVDGYIFDGWYDAEGKSAELVKEIKPGETGAIELYAHWRLVEYTISFNSPLVPVESKTYTVKSGATLTNPALANYTFIGWSDNDGKVVTSIKPGTTGDITLYANWTSRRNQTRPKANYGTPIVVEDEENGIIIYAYEIGTIENIPIADLSEVYTAVSGMKQTFTTSGTTSISEGKAAGIANAVSETTTKSGAWSLASTWNNTTSVDKGWAESNGMSIEEAESISKTESNTYSLNSSSGGTTSSVTTNGIAGKTTSSNSNSNTESAEIAASFKETAEVDAYVAKASMEVEVSAKGSVSGTQSNTHGSENGYNTSKTTTNDSTWNSSSGYSASNQLSKNNSIKNTLSSSISETYNYGTSYAEGGTNSSTQSFANSSNSSSQYNSEVTYNRMDTEVASQTLEFGGESDGYYKVVLAGKAHVFGVVGYDVRTSSYFTYSYSVMDDETYPWVDYSKTTASFDDCENGILPFEVPYAIKEYVDARTAKTEGLVINTTTGIIEDYIGTDNAIMIPAYLVVNNIDGNGNSKVVKVRGIASNAFRNNKSIMAISLPSFITEIPDNAFENCSSLVEISGSGIESIGDNAFNGCSDLGQFTVSDYITHIGANAFGSVDSIVVNACSADVAKATVGSGAKNIILNISKISEEVLGEKVTFTVPSSVESFELQGGNKIFEDLKIDSASETTYLNGFTVTNCTRIPLSIASNNLILNGIAIDAPSYVMLLSNDTTNLSVYQENRLNSASGKCIVSKNISIMTYKPGVASSLIVNGNIYKYGTITGNNYLNIETGSIIDITDAEYSKYIQGSFYLNYNPNGGILNESSKLVYCGSKVGELPIPTRQYFDFVGWYTDKEGGDVVTNETVLDDASDITVFAHWKNKTFNVTFNANGGKVNTTEAQKTCGVQVGTLPTPSKDYYHFDGWYTEVSGGTKVTESTVLNNESSITLYAHWTVNAYSVSWDNGTGYKITVNRKSSPNKGAATGEISNGAAVYYGDVLSITYSATTGYEIKSYGSTDITVTGNVDRNTICCSANAKNIPYNVVYLSSNGTALGSTTVTYAYASGAHSISAPAKSGYNTPPAQSVQWDSASAKTITFVYYPTSVSNSQSIGSGWWWQYNTSNNGVRYSATAEIGTRTSSSVQIRIKWTNSITNAMYGYIQTFSASVNGWNTANTGSVTIANASKWNGGYYTDSTTAYSGWMTVPVSATTTSVAIACDYQTQGSYTGSVNKTITIPTF